MVTELTGALTGLKVLYFTLAGTILLSSYVGVAWLTGRFTLRDLRRRFRPWYGYLCFWGFWMVVWGLFQQHPLANYVAESCAMVLFLVGVPIGASARNWAHLDRIFPLALGFIGVPLVVAGIVAAGGFSSEQLRSGLVYTASAVLIPATFYVLVSPRLGSKLRQRLVAVAFALYGIGQFLFVKRAPLVRVLVVFLLAYWLIPAWTKQQRLKRRAAGILVLGIAIVLVTAAGGVWDSVIARFNKLGAVVSVVQNPTSPGVWQDPQAENETFRFKEVAYFFDDMSPLQKLLGTGLGSYSTSPMLTRNWEVYTGDAGSVIPGKSVTHIGMFWAFFKGGALFFVLFHVGIIAALWQFKRVRQNPLKLNAWAFVLTYLLFSMVEGFWMSPGVELTTLLMGASIGVLIARERAW